MYVFISIKKSIQSPDFSLCKVCPSERLFNRVYFEINSKKSVNKSLSFVVGINMLLIK